MLDQDGARQGLEDACGSNECGAPRRSRAGSRLRALAAGLVAAVVLAACGGHDDGGPQPVAPPTISVLSNRADLVSGGDVLLEVALPAGVAVSALTVNAGGRDVTSQFAARPSSNGRIIGLVTGLATGNNVVTASAMGSSSTLTINNHPIGGPVYSGAQIQPWVCATPNPTAVSGNTPASNASGLTTSATDAQCNIATEFKLFYRTTTAGCSAALPDPSPPAAAPTNPCFKPYTAGSAAPADLATTTTDAGLTVPYIVRVERGTVNRGIFDVAVLYDPTSAWTPTAPQPQWNRKVVYTFGASTGQPRRQYRTEQSWNDDAALSRGFMVVDNSLTDSLYNSNRVLMTETLMMMKEHIVDAYGELKYVAGNGCSGGSIQQNTASNIYPGLLDGIQVSCDFPDSITTGTEVGDCVLLVNFYTSPQWTALMTGLTQAQINAKKTAINGHLDQLGCHAWNNAFGNANKPGNYVPRVVLNANGDMAPFGAARNNCELPAALVYDAATNPTGIRCTDPDAAVAVWGTAPGTTRANLTTDNVGVQYGLKAVKAGAITAEEFVTLNERIGGTDADNNLVTARAVADAAGLTVAYRAGILSNGQNLGKVAIIDQRGYDEQGIHYNWRSYSERDRLDADAGGHGNQVIWRYGAALLAPAASGLPLQSLLTMDTWLLALNSAAPKTFINGSRTQTQVIAAKPATAFDFCYLTADTTYTTKVTDQATCDADARLAVHASPRQVAGGARTENILKCQLKPLDVSDYAPGVLTAAQLTRMRTVFPTGVCDWTKPGVGQQAPISPLDFTTGAGGQPFPAIPASRGS
ncbi:MAG: DUF6351 family protein [Burkholderiaceae bacterium]